MGTNIKINDYGSIRGECYKLAKGVVQFYDKNGKLEDIQNNLITYIGREFLAQKLSDIYNSTSDRFNYKDYKITHFGVGCGGHSCIDSTITKVGPHNIDTHLYLPLTIGPALNIADGYEDKDNSYTDPKNFYINYFNASGELIPRVLKPIYSPIDSSSDVPGWRDKITDNVIMKYPNYFPGANSVDQGDMTAISGDNAWVASWDQSAQIVRDIDTDNRDLIARYMLKIQLWELPDRFIGKDGEALTEANNVPISELALFATRQQYKVENADLSYEYFNTFNDDMTPNYNGVAKMSEEQLDGMTIEEYWLKKCAEPKMISHVTIAPKYFESKESYLIVWNILT